MQRKRREGLCTIPPPTSSLFLWSIILSVHYPSHVIQVGINQSQNYTRLQPTASRHPLTVAIILPSHTGSVRKPQSHRVRQTPHKRSGLNPGHRKGCGGFADGPERVYLPGLVDINYKEMVGVPGSILTMGAICMSLYILPMSA